MLCFEVKIKINCARIGLVLSIGDWYGIDICLNIYKCVIDDILALIPFLGGDQWLILLREHDNCFTCQALSNFFPAAVIKIRKKDVNEKAWGVMNSK